jgi:hypothetical protein
MDAIMFEALIFPDPLRLKKMMSWERAVARLALQPENVTKQLSERFGLAEEVEVAPTHDAAHALTVARRIAGRAAEIGDLTVFVQAPDDHHVFELKPEAWRQHDGRLFHCVTLATTGRFSIASDLLATGTPEARVVGKALYVEVRQLDRLLHRRGPSFAAVEKAAKAIKLKHADGDENTPMARGTFVSELQAAVPGLSKAQALKAWASTVPASWKKAGRRRK